MAAVSAFLREPQGRTRRLLAANRKWLTALERRRNSRLAVAELRRHVARFDFPQEQGFRELLGDDARSRLLTSYHFGDYIYGLNLLGATVKPHAKVVFMAQAPGSAAYFANMKLGFGANAMGPDSQLLAQEAGIDGLAPLLRRPGVQFITFCDLGEQFGGRIQADFLFRQAWFSRGPAM